MRDYLDGAAQKIAASFFGDDGAVYLAGGDIGVGGELGVDKAFVITQVEVGLRAVFGDEYFTVLVGRHGARVDIEIGV